MIALPKRSWPTWVLAIAVWVTAPGLSEKYFTITQALGWYSPDADTIALPIAGNYIFAVIGFPFWLILCYFAFTQFPSSQSIFAWDPRHWVYSSVTTIIFALLMLFNALEFVGYFPLYREIVSNGDPRDAIHVIFLCIASAGWILTWLCMRSCFIAKRIAEKPKNSACTGE